MSGQTSDLRVDASVTFTEKVVPVVRPESKPFDPMGVHGSANVDWVTECGMLLHFWSKQRCGGGEIVITHEAKTKVTSVPAAAFMSDGLNVRPPLGPTCTFRSYE